MNLVLIGMPGSGKSATGRETARLSGRRVVDTDREIEKVYGDISAIFSNKGEEFFRNAEREIIRKVSAYKGVIISTGGGTVLSEENMALLKADGFVVYLKADAEVLSRRTARGGRPLLEGGKDRIRKLMNERTPLYEKYADMTVDADSDDLEKKARLILGEFFKREKK